MRRLFWLALTLLPVLAACEPEFAWAQYPPGPPVTPFVATTTMAAITITTGATFQSVLAANVNRRGCLVQNTSTHTMYVYFGATASATTANSLQVVPGGTISCDAGHGVVLTDNIAVTTSTTSDTGIVASQ